MEQAGGEVLVLPADVSDLNAMRAAVAQARERFGSIDGVIHAAGLPGGGIIQLKDKAQAHRVLQPKVHGTLILEEALAGASPRFIALCSSTAAILGGFGQVDYCAANAFLDAFAHSRPAAARIVSINWDAWKEVGMAVETAAGGLQATRNVVLKLGISPAEGAQAFEWSLASGLAQVAISKIDMMPKLLRRRPRRTAEPQVETAAGEPGGSVEPAEQGPGADIERTIADVWKRVLGIDRVGANDNFFELGGDSLTALQVIGLLKSRLGTDLAVVTFYEAPTVSLLAKALGGGSDPAPDRPGLDEVGQRAETRLELMQRRRRQRIDSTASEG